MFVELERESAEGLFFVFVKANKENKQKISSIFQLLDFYAVFYGLPSIACAYRLRAVYIPLRRIPNLIRTQNICLALGFCVTFYTELIRLATCIPTEYSYITFFLLRAIWK